MYWNRSVGARELQLWQGCCSMITLLLHRIHNPPDHNAQTPRRVHTLSFLSKPMPLPGLGKGTAPGHVFNALFLPSDLPKADRSTSSTLSTTPTPITHPPTHRTHHPQQRTASRQGNSPKTMPPSAPAQGLQMGLSRPNSAESGLNEDVPPPPMIYHKASSVRSQSTRHLKPVKGYVLHGQKQAV